MSKRFHNILKITLFICLCATLVFATVACDLFGGGSSEDNRNNIVKPNISKAQKDYDALSTKASSVDASATVSFFSKDAKDAVISTDVTESIVLERILNGDKFFAKAKLSTAKCDDSIVALYKQVRKLVSSKEDEYDATADPVIDYLESSSAASLSMGYKDCYNVAAEYLSEKTPSKKRYAFDDKAITDCFDGKSDFVLASYLSASEIFDFNKASEWVSEDKASRFFSTDKNNFIYQLKADENKIKGMLIDKLDAILPLLTADNLSEDSCDKISEFISGWIKINPTSVDALVSDKGLPHSTTVNFSFDVNVDFADLDQVLFLAFGKDKKEELSGYVNALATLKSLCGTNGEDRTLGLRITINEKQKFFYDAKHCGFPSDSDEMFLSVDEAVEGRTVVTAGDIKKAFSNVMTLIFGDSDSAKTEENIESSTDADK